MNKRTDIHPGIIVFVLFFLFFGTKISWWILIPLAYMVMPYFKQYESDQCDNRKRKNEKAKRDYQPDEMLYREDEPPLIIVDDSYERQRRNGGA